jgi:hypothetical protein
MASPFWWRCPGKKEGLGGMPAASLIQEQEQEQQQLEQGIEKWTNGRRSARRGRQKKKRNGLGWCFISLTLSRLFLLLLLPPLLPERASFRPCLHPQQRLSIAVFLLVFAPS